MQPLNRSRILQMLALDDAEMGEFIGSTIEPSNNSESGERIEMPSLEPSLKDEDEKGFAAAYDDYAQERWDPRSFATTKPCFSFGAPGRRTHFPLSARRALPG